MVRGATGYDWVIKSFELARKYFPKAELLLNDYNVEANDSSASDYLAIINLLKARGLLDGIGLQAHFLERAEVSVVAANLDRFAATGLPIYISELDLNLSNDARQAQRMRDLFTLFWQHPSVLGVTHWGYLQGNMWQPDAYLVRTDGTRRPALDWLTCFRGGGSNCPVPDYVPSPRTGDSASITLQAEDYDDMHGIQAAGDAIAYVDNGDWESFSRVVFDKNWDSLSVTYTNGGSTPTSVTLHGDSLTGPVLATVQLPPTGGWSTNNTVSVPFLPISGERNVFVAFGGGVNVDKFSFSAPAGDGPNLIANGEFEANTNGWYSWNGTLSTSTQFAVSGAQSLRSTNRDGNGPIAHQPVRARGPGQELRRQPVDDGQRCCCQRQRHASRELRRANRVHLVDQPGGRASRAMDAADGHAQRPRLRAERHSDLRRRTGQRRSVFGSRLGARETSHEHRQQRHVRVRHQRLVHVQRRRVLHDRARAQRHAQLADRQSHGQRPGGDRPVPGRHQRRELQRELLGVDRWCRERQREPHSKGHL